jgi:ribonuclease-3
MDAQALQVALGHEFSSKALLQQALTHRSHSGLHNERLEFLGDSVLNCVVASMLFERFAKIDEGDLSRLRANLVKQQSLYEIAQRLELSQYLRLGEGELKSGGFRRPSILADTVEALFGAIFLDAGFDVARKAINRLYGPVLETVDPKTLGKDAKTLLQEYLQSRKIALPVYNVVATHGAAHSQEFEVECSVPKLSIQVLGSGGSRRGAEQAAAKKALEAAQQLALQTSKRARRPKQAQLALPVAVAQSAEQPAAAATAKAAKLLALAEKGEARAAASEKVAEKVSEKVPEKVSEKVPEKVSEKGSEKAPEKASEKTAEKASEKSERSTEKAAERSSERAAEKAAEKGVDKTPEKASEKSTEKASEKLVERTSARSSDKNGEKLTVASSDERQAGSPPAAQISPLTATVAALDELARDAGESPNKLKARVA